MGSLGLWLLLYGVRRGNLALVGGSGLLAGACLYFGNMAFAVIGLILWTGLALTRRPWLHFRRLALGALRGRGLAIGAARSW